MSTLLVHLPESLHKQLEALAKREGITVDQLVTTSVAEKVSALNISVPIVGGPVELPY